MNYDTLTLSSDSGIARITLQRPQELNAMTRQMGEEIRDAVKAINSDPEARVVVVRGEGKAFCSGASLSNLGAEAGVGDGNIGLGGGLEFYKLFLSIRDLAVPSIAAINGHAIGAGLCFAVACDLRIMHEKAKAGMTFTRLGIHPGMAATWNLPRLIGPSKAADLLYSGRLVGAAEALELGLVNRVAGEDFDAAVDAFATQVAEAGPIAVRRLKQTLAGTYDRSIDEALEIEATVQAETFDTEDAAEGIKAVMEKRKPAFKGR